VKREKPPKSLIVPPAKQLDDIIPLCFSFKHLDLYGNAKFCLEKCAEGYLDKFLCRLRDLSGLSVKDFRTNKNKALRIHRLRWEETSEPAGFACLNPQLKEQEAWQFEISANEHGRVHGVLLDNTFFVVWIDPRHEMYP